MTYCTSVRWAIFTKHSWDNKVSTRCTLQKLARNSSLSRDFLPIVLWRLWIWAYYFVHMLFFAYYNQLINQHTFSKQRLLHSKPICNFFLQVSSESQSFAQVYGFCSARVHFICSSCAQTPQLLSGVVESLSMVLINRTPCTSFVP